MKKLGTILGAMLISSTVLAAQSPEPKNISCLIQRIEMKDTRMEKLVSETTVKPVFNKAGRDGSEYKAIVKNANYEIGVTLSYLDYSPLLEMTVKSGKVSTATGLKAEVSQTGSEITTVAECSYTPGE